MDNVTPIKLNEKKRTYKYVRDGKIVEVILENVIELIVRESGSHKIKTSDGKLHYLPSDYIHIEIEDDKKEWTN
ncbi:gp222 [Bacillus phage G]|uniref:Gp222 n=1 Tax=Bacillus phage G TaxID=2884420 RepID=G3M9W3_9CAUD|nr:gp222 [Bacillus phage G]AEO93481.1 gp222 [Bacillus phage G]